MSRYIEQVRHKDQASSGLVRFRPGPPRNTKTTFGWFFIYTGFTPPIDFLASRQFSHGYLVVESEDLLKVDHLLYQPREKVYEQFLL